MAKIVRFHQIGGPDVMKIEEAPFEGAWQRRSEIASSGYRSESSRVHVQAWR
jgi:hypothetical protein